jgi:hypothetical protein
MYIGERQVSESALHECSLALVDLITREVRDKRGVHAETAIAAAGLITGRSLARALDPAMYERERIAPDSMLDTDQIWPTVVDYVAKTLRAVGIDPSTGWNEEVPEEHAPAMSRLVNDRMLIVWAQMSLDEFLIPAPWQPVAVAMAMAEMIVMTRQVCPPEVAKAVAGLGLLHGSGKQGRLLSLAAA